MYPLEEHRLAIPLSLLRFLGQELDLEYLDPGARLKRRASRLVLVRRAVRELDELLNGGDRILIRAHSSHRQVSKPGLSMPNMLSIKSLGYASVFPVLGLTGVPSNVIRGRSPITSAWWST